MDFLIHYYKYYLSKAEFVCNFHGYTESNIFHIVFYKIICRFFLTFDTFTVLNIVIF